MIKAILLVFAPVQAWDSILRDKRSTLFVFWIFLIPLLALTSLAEGWGLMQYGEQQVGLRKFIRKLSLEEAVGYQAAQMILSVAVVFVGATIMKSLGETFHGRNTYSQAFKTVAYGLSPLFALRVLDTFSISPWIAWTLGILLSATVLYHGVPRIMQPDPSHAFGLFLTSILVLTITTGLLRYVTAGYLQGQFRALPMSSLDWNWCMLWA
jgi:hypothetical protein